MHINKTSPIFTLSNNKNTYVMRILIITIILFCSTCVFAQNPFEQPQQDTTEIIHETKRWVRINNPSKGKVEIWRRGKEITLLKNNQDVQVIPCNSRKEAKTAYNYYIKMYSM